MRVELPSGYVPPEPTHPLYGYLTPEELEAYEAEERARLGIVPEPPEPGSQEAEAAVEEPDEEQVQAWAPAVSGWVPSAPTESQTPEPEVEPDVDPDVEPEVEQTHRREPVHQVAVDPVVEELPPAAPATEPEYRWDAYQQKWIPVTGPASQAGEEQPPPDHAAAAGGRGASSSWTSADGQRFRWDARTQQWTVEPVEPGRPSD